jgi:hypothetical protein
MDKREQKIGMSMGEEYRLEEEKIWEYWERIKGRNEQKNGTEE